MIGGDSIKSYEKEILQMYLDNEKTYVKDVEKAYKEALKDIDTRLAALMGRADADLPNVIYRIEHQKNLKLQVQAVLEQLQANEFDVITKHLSSSYTDGFIAGAYSLHKQGVPLVFPIDPAQVVKAVTLDSQISEGLYKRLGVETKVLKNAISGEISRGIASGMAYSDIARNISAVTKAPLARTKTIVRTEAGRIHTRATMDMAHEARSKGADVLKKWISVLDGSTRPSHQRMDGEIRELDEPFSNGLQHPKARGGKAEEVINCRCEVGNPARWSLDEDDLERMKQRAAFFGLDKTKNIEEFREKYLNAVKTLENTGENGIIKETEMLKKKDDAREGFKFISNERFNNLTIEAVKNGAIILRGSEEIEKHLDAMEASASTIGGALLFRNDVCVSEVLEETFHYMQNLSGTNDDKGEPLRTILNEIEAKEHVLANANKYKVPRNELDLIEKQLAGYKKQLEEYEKDGE